MQLTPDDIANLFIAAFVLNIVAVFAALILYDAVCWVLSWAAGRNSPEWQGCTPVGGVGEKHPDDNFGPCGSALVTTRDDQTTGDVIAPAVTWRAAGHSSGRGAHE